MSYSVDFICWALNSYIELANGHMPLNGESKPREKKSHHSVTEMVAVTKTDIDIGMLGISRNRAWRRITCKQSLQVADLEREFNGLHRQQQYIVDYFMIDPREKNHLMPPWVLHSVYRLLGVLNKKALEGTK